MTLITAEYLGENNYIFTADRNVIGGQTRKIEVNKILYCPSEIHGDMIISFAGCYIDRRLFILLVGEFCAKDGYIGIHNIKDFYIFIEDYFKTTIKDFYISIIIANHEGVFLYDEGNIIRLNSDNKFLSTGSGSIFAKSIYEYIKRIGLDIDYKILYDLISSNLEGTISSKFDKQEFKYEDLTLKLK